MDFEYTDYFGKLVLNPTDCILRFEHKKTSRIYEQTYYDRDFPDFATLGGLDFVGHLLRLCFTSTDHVCVKNFRESPTILHLEIHHENPILLRPLVLAITIPAIRKQSGNSDLETMNRKITELSATFAKKLDPLLTRIVALEERCGDSIVIPGCPNAIPVSSTCLALVRDKTALPSGHYYAHVYPGAIYYHSSYPEPNWNSPFYNQSMNSAGVNAQAFPYIGYAHSGLTSLNNLVYLTKCTHLTLSGIPEIMDFSPIAKMTWLTSLSIVASCKGTQNPPTVNGNIPVLKNIAWITALKGLTSLSFLGCTELADITPLRELPKLTDLDIRGTAVKNVAFLTNASIKISQ